jgi:NADH:ubiquinone oxidoreductase subunit F (NADH-binding)/(2Fe-2S) ferredoxin
MVFDEIRQKAILEWEKLQDNKVPCIFVGTATCGRAAGAEEVIEVIKGELQNRKVDASIIEVGCIGLCCFEPLVDIKKPGSPRISYSRVTSKIAREIIEDYIGGDNPRPDLALGVFAEKSYQRIPTISSHPMLKDQIRIVLRNCGYIDPENINHYIACAGYLGFVKALKMGPGKIIDQIRESGLRGRGGAGFPTGKKWEICRQALQDEKYIVCNADEGDPGAFMNRALLESDPHSVLEGMLIAGYAIGASYGYIYIRAEYPLAIKRLRKAILQMQECGLLGKDILGSGFNFDIEIREGAGAFVCGEETALIASLQGLRGYPSPRPPYPAVSGFRGKPTVINNVETLATVPSIIRNGPEWYTRYGTEGSKGTKTFALAGKVKRTGLIEVPMGITLKKIVYDVGGGIVDDKGFKAIQTGGPSGGCLSKEFLDLGVDYESLTSAGSIMGSGGMIVMDEDTCPIDIAHYFLSFIQAESCGKCVPCRVGTRQMLKLLERIKEGQGQLQDIERLQDLAQTVKLGSLCGLGQTAPNPVLTTIKYFKEEYEAHIKDKRCPARVCRDLLTYFIDPEACTGCAACKEACPASAIQGKTKQPHTIEHSKCIRCGVCLDICRFDAVKVK